MCVLDTNELMKKTKTIKKTKQNKTRTLNKVSKFELQIENAPGMFFFSIIIQLSICITVPPNKLCVSFILLVVFSHIYFILLLFGCSALVVHIQSTLLFYFQFNEFFSFLFFSFFFLFSFLHSFRPKGFF